MSGRPARHFAARSRDSTTAYSPPPEPASSVTSPFRAVGDGRTTLGRECAAVPRFGSVPNLPVRHLSSGPSGDFQGRGGSRPPGPGTDASSTTARTRAPPPSCASLSNTPSFERGGCRQAAGARATAALVRPSRCGGRRSVVPFCEPQSRGRPLLPEPMQPRRHRGPAVQLAASPWSRRVGAEVGDPPGTSRPDP
jgi:hypothetical protein